MIERFKLSTEIESNLNSPIEAWKANVTGRKLVELDELQYLSITPWTTIKKHGHNNQWEVYIYPQKKRAYICPKGEEHMLMNQTYKKIKIFSVKGHSDYTYEDLADFFTSLDFEVFHGSLIEKDT